MSRALGPAFVLGTICLISTVFVGTSLGGTPAPKVWLKESEAGLTDIVVEVTVKVTGTVSGLLSTPLAVMVTALV